MKKWFANVYVLIVVLISLLGIATSSLLFLLIPGPDEVVRLMQWRMAGVKSYATEIDVRYRGERVTRGASAGKHAEAVTFRDSALLDATDLAARTSSDAFSLTIGADDVGGEKPLSFSGRHAAIGRARYFTFTQLPDLIGSVHFGQFRDKPLRIDVEKLLADTGLPFVGGGRPPLSSEDRDLLAADFRVTPFVAVTDTLGSEKIGGAPTFHYKVKPEILFFRDFYALTEAKRLGRELTGKERQVIETFFADVVPEDGELWIGKRDYFLRRLRLRFRFDDGTRNGTFDVTAEFSRFNERFAIAQPTGTVEDATPFLASLLAGVKSHLPLAKEGTVLRGTDEDSGTGLPVDYAPVGDSDPDKDDLPNSLEGFYGTDARNPDTDGDGMSDGAEVSQGRNPSGAGMLFDFTPVQGRE